MTKWGGKGGVFFAFFSFSYNIKKLIMYHQAIGEEKNPNIWQHVQRFNRTKKGSRKREIETEKYHNVIGCDCCSQLYRSQEVAPRNYHCIHSSQNSACCI